MVLIESARDKVLKLIIPDPSFFPIFTEFKLLIPGIYFSLFLSDIYFALDVEPY